jgi:hypothetical protein
MVLGYVVVVVVPALVFIYLNGLFCRTITLSEGDAGNCNSREDVIMPREVHHLIPDYLAISRTSQPVTPTPDRTGLHLVLNGKRLSPTLNRKHSRQQQTVRTHYDMTLSSNFSNVTIVTQNGNGSSPS